MGARHWIEPETFAHIGKRLNDLLYDDKNFEGFVFPYGPITCERLQCRIGEYDVYLNRFTGQPNMPFVGCLAPEAAFTELIISGSMAVAVVRATSRRLHDMMLVAHTGTSFSVRRGARVSMQLLEREAHSLIVTSCPPRFNGLPPLDQMKFNTVLRPFRDHYWGIDPNDML